MTTTAADRRHRAPSALKRATDLPGEPVITLGTLTISERAKALVMDALNSNRLSYGPLTQRFEAEFSRLHGCRFGLMSNSGTGALQVALQVMKELHGWADGDEVIVPAVTFVATANIVLHNRLTPVLADIEPTYYELDPERLDAAITPRTRAIIPVHLFGHPADMSPIYDIARRHGLKVIEDSCETMFASYQGRPVGSLGDIGCFSTYVAHLLVTGVGGMSTTNDPEYAVRMRSLVNHGRDSIYVSIDDDDDKRGEALRTIVARRFQFVSVGHSFRATEMEAALGLAQLDGWESMIAARRANAAGLIQRLRHLEAHLQLPATRPGSEHSFMMFPLVLRHEPKGDLVHFLESNGVETRDMLPLTNQPVYHKLLGWREADYPVAAHVNRSGLYVGCHQDLGESDLDTLADLLSRYHTHGSRRTRSGTCLLLTVGEQTAAAERALEELPRRLFDRIIALDAGASPALRERLSGEGVDVVPLNAADPMRLVLEGRVPIEEDVLVFFSADGRHESREAGRLALMMERGYDMVIGSRFVPGAGRHDRAQRVRYRSLGNRLFTLAADLLAFGTLTDTLSPLRAIRRRRLLEAAPEQQGLCGLYQLSIRAMRSGWRIAELPIVETVASGQHDRRRAWSSLVPLARVLTGEWWRARRAPGGPRAA